MSRITDALTIDYKDWVDRVVHAEQEFSEDELVVLKVVQGFFFLFFPIKTKRLVPFQLLL